MELHEPAKGHLQRPDGQMPAQMLATDCVTVELRGGMQVRIRPIRVEDAPRLQALFSRLSQESIYYRFLGLRKELSTEQALRLADLDYLTQMALVATHGDGREEEVISVARYAVVPGSCPLEAEAAVVVEDRHQCKGLGTLLLDRLVAYASAHGIQVFRATINHDNARILRLIRRSGLPAESRTEAGVVTLRVALGSEPGSDTGLGGAPGKGSQPCQGGGNRPCSSATA